MSGGNNSSKGEKKELPIQRDHFDDKQSYITIIFSPFSRSDMIDPEGGILEPNKVYDKAHMVHALAWQQGNLDVWEEKDVELKQQDKVLYIDCSYMKINPAVCGFPGTDQMMGFLLFAIESIKSYLDIMTAKGYKGKVHFNLCGYAPVEVLMYALKCILDHSSPNMSPYNRFAKKALAKYSSTFKRYENNGFPFVVDYSCIYECYFVETHKETPATISSKIAAIDQYCIKLKNHNDINSSTHDLQEEHMAWSPQLGKDVVFHYAKGNPADEGYVYGSYDKIEYHGRYLYLHELERLKDELRSKKNDMILEEQALIREWNKLSVSEQEYAKFAPKQVENIKLHKKNEALIQQTQEAYDQLYRQMNDPNSVEYQAYMQGHIIHAEENDLASYHDLQQMEFDGKYVTLDVLEMRIKRYEKELEKSDKETLEAEKDAIHEIDTRWIKNTWRVVRIAVGIGTFIWGPLVFVDLAFEVFDMGYEFYDKDQKVDWTHLIGIGADLVAVVLMHGGAAKSIINGMKEGTEMVVGGKAGRAYLESKGVTGLAEGKTSLEGVTDVKITEEIKNTATELNNVNLDIVNRTQAIRDLEKVRDIKTAMATDYEGVSGFERLNAKSYASGLSDTIIIEKTNLVKARKYAIGKKNELAYLIYDAEKVKKNIELKNYISDVRLYFSNFNNLTLNGKIWAGGKIFVDSAGKGYTIKGICDNTNFLVD